MNYTEFRQEMEDFPNFSIREIEKHFPGFDSRRLVEWQEKVYTHFEDVVRQYEF